MYQRRLSTVVVVLAYLAVGATTALGQCVVNERAILPKGGGPASVSGDVLLVGFAQVYRFDGSEWVPEATLLPADKPLPEGYAVASAVHGDVAIVGARSDDDNGPNSGSAYIFRFDGSQWFEEQKLLASDGKELDLFGFSAAMSSIAVVGTGAEKAYVFRFNGSEWTEEQILTPSDADGDFHAFGRSTGVSGDIAVIGAKAGRGSAYVFRYTGTQWVEEQKFLASDGESGDGFGQSVAISGDTVVVGANLTGDNIGSAYVFRFTGKKWIEQQILQASDMEAGDQFGVSVSVSGDVIVVGAVTSDDNTGSAYVFRFNTTSTRRRPPPARIDRKPLKRNKSF